MKNEIQPDFMLISISLSFPEEGMTQQNGTLTAVCADTQAHTLSLSLSLWLPLGGGWCNRLKKTVFI